MFLCSYSATFIGLKCHSDPVRWSSAMAASIHDDRRTLEVKSGGRVTCDLPLWSQPLDIQPTKQIRGNSATSTHLTAESLFAHFTQVLTFHGAVIRPPVGAWRPTPCLTVWSVFLFIHHCGEWPVATLPWFPKWTVILLWCCRNRKTQREQNCWDSPPEICVRGYGWLVAAAAALSDHFECTNDECGATSDTQAEDERSISFSAESFISPGCCAVFCFSQHVLISQCTYFSARIIWSGNTLISLLIKAHGRHLGHYPSLQWELSQPASYLNVDIWTWE